MHSCRRRDVVICIALVACGALLSSFALLGGPGLAARDHRTWHSKMQALEPQLKVGGNHASVVPAGLTKTVHFVRHGQAWSNVAGEVDRTQYKNEKYFDASLSPDGWQQAEALGRHVRAVGLQPELVVVSPLTRALQTASAAFGGGALAPGAKASPLMVAFEDGGDTQVAHAAISSQGAPPFLAHELCREQMGRNPCDRRRNTGHYRKHFPAVDWSLIAQETDELWVPDEREAREAVAARGAQFLSWLLSRPEREIAVVSHSGFLNLTLSSLASSGLSAAASDQFTRWFENCELRSFVFAVPAGEQLVHVPEHFPGGMKALGELPN